MVVILNGRVKALICFAGIACAAMTAESRVVHSPVESLTSGENPHVDSRGGTWTAARVQLATDLPSSSSLLTTAYAASSQGKGFSNGADENPRIAVNNGTTNLKPDENGAVLRPGEVFMYPGAGTGKDRAMLTFTVPRDGWYSLTAQFRAIGEASWHSIDTAIRLGELILNQDENIHRTTTPVNGKRVSFVKKRLKKGTQISFVLGPCAYDESHYGGWQNHKDAAALNLQIVEEDDGEIVHEPKDALASGANPGTDSMGGTWTALCCEYGNDLPSVATKLSEAATVVGSSGKGFAKATKGYPSVAVNDTAGDLKPDANGTALKPGEVFMYPAAGSGQRRAMLLFTVPRNGWYSLNAQFRTIGDDNWYHVDTTIALDGFVLFQEEIHRTSLGLKGRAYSFRERFLKKGARLAFTVGPGWYDDKNYGGWQNDSDATALNVKIVERNYDRLPELDAAVADLGSALLTATTETAAGGRVADASGIGSWEIYDTKAKDKSLDMGGKQAMSEVMASALGERGVRFESARSDEEIPSLQVCGFTKVESAGNGSATTAFGKGRRWPVDALAPGEVLVQNYYPDANGGHVAVRFVPNEAGVYVVSVKARDVNYGEYSDGVDVSVWIAGTQSVRQLVSVEQSDVTLTWMNYQTDQIQLAAKMPVDVIVSPRDWHAFDDTGLSVEIVKLPEILEPTGADAFAALADMAAAEPLVNSFVSQGATWQLGARTLGESSSFGLLSNLLGNTADGVVGFKGDDGYPRVCANTNKVAKYKDGCWFYPGEFLMHPAQSKSAALRYLAPSSGVYAVRAQFRDISYMDWGEGTESCTGVRCYLMVDGVYAAGGDASCDGHTDVEGDAVLKARRVYRAAGAPIDIVVNSRNSHHESDMTAVRAFIEPEVALSVVSVDFNAPDSSVYSGAGRVGYDGGVWKSLVVRAGASGAQCRHLRNDCGEKTGVGVRIQAPAGGCVLADGKGHALMSDGFASGNSSAAYGWSVSGLIAGQSYVLYLYGTGTAVFTVAGKDYSPDATAFSGLTRQVVAVEVTADENGEVAGAFCGTTDAVFCGMQIEGACFEPYVQTGLSVIIR